MKTLALHPQLELVGVTDRDESRLAAFTAYHGVRRFDSVSALLDEGSVELVLNLTNPDSHYEVSRAALEAGKHVYTEKPLAMDFEEAKQLVALAERLDLHIAAAPSRLLAETAQTMWKGLRDGVIGPVWLAYAELDDGLVHRMPYKDWISDSGAPWPYKDEFEVGCTVEHAGYALTWLTAFFGPAESVTGFSSCLIKDKQTDVPLDGETPDFSVGCIQFRDGQVARMTNSIVAPRDHALRLFGEDGVMYVEDNWAPCAPVYVRRRIRIRRRTMLTPWKRRLPMPKDPRIPPRIKGLKKVDYMLGVVELAASIQEERPCRLSHGFCLHITELTLAVQNALATAAPIRLESTFDPIDPMPWSA